MDRAGRVVDDDDPFPPDAETSLLSPGRYPSSHSEVEDTTLSNVHLLQGQWTEIEDPVKPVLLKIPQYIREAELHVETFTDHTQPTLRQQWGRLILVWAGVDRLIAKFEVSPLVQIEQLSQPSEGLAAHLRGVLTQFEAAGFSIIRPDSAGPWYRYRFEHPEFRIVGSSTSAPLRSLDGRYREQESYQERHRRWREEALEKEAAGSSSWLSRITAPRRKAIPYDSGVSTPIRKRPSIDGGAWSPNQIPSRPDLIDFSNVPDRVLVTRLYLPSGRDAPPAASKPIAMSMDPVMAERMSQRIETLEHRLDLLYQELDYAAEDLELIRSRLETNDTSGLRDRLSTADLWYKNLSAQVDSLKRDKDRLIFWLKQGE